MIKWKAARKLSSVSISMVLLGHLIRAWTFGHNDVILLHDFCRFFVFHSTEQAKSGVNGERKYIIYNADGQKRKIDTCSDVLTV